MISTKSEFLQSKDSVLTLSKELAESILKSTRNKKLKRLVSKGIYTITSELHTELVTKLNQLTTNMSKARENVNLKTAGRKRIDYTEEELKNLSPEALKRYKNAVWQRQSRFNRGITKNA